MFNCRSITCRRSHNSSCTTKIFLAKCIHSTYTVYPKKVFLKDFNSIPGPKSYPIIGTLYKYLPFVGDYSSEALDKNARLNWCRYGQMAKELPGVRLLHVFDPDLIEAVFRQDDRLPARRSHVAMLHYRLSKPNVYNTGGLLATNGPEWWRLRSAFQKNFTSPQSVKQHVSSADAVIREFIQWLQASNVTPYDDFLNYLNRLNLEVIGLVAFNERFNSFSNEELHPESRSSKTIAAAFGSNNGIVKLDKGFLWRMFPTPLYRRLAKSQQWLEKVSNEILLNKLEFFETDKREGSHSLLDGFMRQKEVDIKDLTGMMVDILMAAIDTTAYATSFALYHLSRHPHCQEELYKEALTLLPNKDDPLTAELLAQAHYTKCCVKESLRLNPVAIGVGRLLQKDISLGGYLVPKDTVVVTQNMLASRLPQYIKDPLAYNPRRWLRGYEDYQHIHPFLSLPFGFGARSCIARRLAQQNIAITLLRLCRSFTLRWAGADEELGVRTLLINKPDRPISLTFTPRAK